MYENRKSYSSDDYNRSSDQMSNDKKSVDQSDEDIDLDDLFDEKKPAKNNENQKLQQIIRNKKYYDSDNSN